MHQLPCVHVNFSAFPVVGGPVEIAAQSGPVELAVAESGERLVGRDHVARQLPTDELVGGLVEQLPGLDAVPDGDDERDLFGPDRVGHAEDQALAHPGQLGEDLLDLLGADVLARALDHVLDAAEEVR